MAELVRSYDLLQDRTRINSWRGKLTLTYHKLFHLIAPIVAQQQNRLSRIATSVFIQVDFSRSIPIERANNKIIWRYMPLRNLLRSEAACGIWMSSLPALRAWSDNHIVDTREGEIPPVVARLKQEYERAAVSVPEALEEFRNAYGLDAEDLGRLPKILANLSLEADNTFVLATASMKLWSVLTETLDATVSQIKLHASDLSFIPIRRSTLPS